MKRKFKLLFLGVIAVFMLSLLCISASATSSNAVLGDMNGDSVVNIDDAIYLLKHTMMPSRYPVSQPADVNGTGDVNIDDAIYLLKHTMMPSRYPIIDPTFCSHKFMQQNTEPVYLKSIASCKSPAVYYHSCICGEVGETTFAVGDTLNHDFGNWIVIEEATSDKNGLKERVCQNCNVIEQIKLLRCPTCYGKGYESFYPGCCTSGRVQATCYRCAGSGKINDPIVCYICDGVGSYVDGLGTTRKCSCDGGRVYPQCYNCNGTGYTLVTCPSCKGNPSQKNCDECNGQGYYDYILLKYNLNGGDGVVEDSVFCGDYCVITDTIPTKSGYVFLGWKDIKTGALYKAGQSYSDDALELYAAWLPICSTCEGEGGSYTESVCTKCDGNYISTSTTKKCNSCGGSYIVGSTTGWGTTYYCKTCSSHDVSITTNTYTCSCGDGKVVTKTPCSYCSGNGYIGDVSDCEIDVSKHIHNYQFHEQKVVTWSEIGWNEYYTCDGCGFSGYVEIPAIGAVLVEKNLSDAGSVEISINPDNSITLKAISNKGYTFLGFYKGDNLVVSTDVYTFTPHKYNKEIAAKWQINNYSVSITQNIVEGGSVSKSGNYDFGTSVTVTATTNTGYTFLGWYEEDTKVYSEHEYTFSITKDVVLTAKWLKNYNVVLQQNISNAGRVAGDGNFVSNSSVTVIARTNMGYTFVGWYENGFPISFDETYTFEISNDRTLIAIWELKEEYAALSDFEFRLTEYSCEITGVIDKTKTEYIIPNYVTSIGSSAFYGCTSLTNITIPNSVTRIEWDAFSGCSGLTSVTIPNSVTSIGSSAFSGCSGLTSITISNSVTSIGSSAFEGCSGLTSVTIPNSVTSIGSYAFYNCSGLTSVTIPNSVTSIGSSAFEGCSGLTSVTIPNSVTSIGSYAFYNCSGLTSVTIPNSVTSIGSYAFEGCSGLTSVTIPDSVTSIGSSAFSGCSGLTSITISNSVTSIGEYAFYNCSGLTSVAIPNSVTKIGLRAFSGCSGLTSVMIPNSVTSIGESAFYGCSGLTSITISNSVTSIGEYAFYNCSGLTSVTIPNSVTKIDLRAFYGCTSLTNITIPNSVTSIGSHAFEGCSGLTSVTIPNSVTSIESGAFYMCNKLVEIINHSRLSLSLGSTSNGDVAYYAKEIHQGSSKIVNQNDYLFYTYGGTNYLLGYIGNDTSLTLPQNYNGKSYEIYKYAFYKCSGLTSITIPNSVTSIGEYAFSGCSGLTSVTIPDSVTSISKYAFYDCSGLTSVMIPNSVTSIEWDAFSGCSGLTSVTIPNSVTSIGSGAFSGCTSLTSITIPNSVTSIGQVAFYRCSGLTSVTIPNSITSIGKYAFEDCSELARITFQGTVSQWKAISTESDWNFNTGSYTIYCTDGTISKIGSVTYN